MNFKVTQHPGGQETSGITASTHRQYTSPRLEHPHSDSMPSTDIMENIDMLEIFMNDYFVPCSCFHFTHIIGFEAVSCNVDCKMKYFCSGWGTVFEMCK